jgi:hypothetical protein
MKLFITAGRLVHDRTLQMLLCSDLKWIMENVDGPTG